MEYKFLLSLHIYFKGMDHLVTLVADPDVEAIVPFGY